jgi:restriction system protein
MAVPDFQSFFKPLLDLAADGKEHSIQEARDIIASQMALPEADMNEKLPSGLQTKFDNRIAWAKSYFVQAQVLESSRRAHFRITSRGLELHRQGLKRIDIKILINTRNLLSSINPKEQGKRNLLHRPKHRKKCFKEHMRALEVT